MALVKWLQRTVHRSLGPRKSLHAYSSYHRAGQPLLLEALESRWCPALTLTQAGMDRGFSLSTFATDFPNIPDYGGIGPVGIGFPSSGGVVVTDAQGNVRHFPTDTDGQSALAAPVGQNYGPGPISFNCVGLAQVGGKIYMTQYSLGQPDKSVMMGFRLKHLLQGQVD